MRANAASMLGGLGGSQAAAQQETAGEDALYRAPRNAAVFFEEEGTQAAKRERREKRIRDRAAKSSIMKMVQEEFAEGPEEAGTGLDVMDVDQEARAEALERQQFEEDHFVRLRPTKAQRKAEKLKFVDDLKSLDDFGDLERALKDARVRSRKEGGAAGEAEGPLSKMAQKLRETQAQEFPAEDNQRVDSRIIRCNSVFV